MGESAIGFEDYDDNQMKELEKTNNEVINEQICELYEKYNKQRIENDSLTVRKHELEASMDDLYKKMNELRSKIV